MMWVPLRRRQTHNFGRLRSRPLLASACIYRILQMQRDRSAESELPELCVLSDAGGHWWNVYQLNPRFMGHKCGQKNTKKHSHFISLCVALRRAFEAPPMIPPPGGKLAAPCTHSPSLVDWVQLRLHPQWDGGDWIAPRSDFGEGLYGAVDATGSLREPNSVVKLDMQRRENGWLSIYRWIMMNHNRSQQIPTDRNGSRYIIYRSQ